MKNSTTPEIRTIKEKKMIGMSVSMSLIDNKTGALFGAFMPRRKELRRIVSPNVYDIRVFENDYHRNFDPSKSFQKMAAMEVHDYDLVPQKMESFDLVGGKYAVFLYKNTAGMAIFEWIFREWLPNSEFDLDDRPHFEVFGEKSIQKDPEAMEEIWIPVKNKLN